MIIQRAIATGILCIMQGIAYGIVILAFFLPWVAILWICERCNK